MTERHLVSDVKRVPLDQLTTHPANPRQGDVGAISESLLAHGMYRPIVVQKSSGHVLAGNHTMLAVAALGWKTVDAVFVDVDDEQALRILVTDNRTAALGTDDPDALVRILRDLANEDGGLTGTGFDDDDLEDLIRSIEMPLSLPPPDVPAGGKPKVDMLCPSCGHEWTP